MTNSNENNNALSQTIMKTIYKCQNQYGNPSQNLLFRDTMRYKPTPVISTVDYNCQAYPSFCRCNTVFITGQSRDDIAYLVTDRAGCRKSLCVNKKIDKQVGKHKLSQLRREKSMTCNYKLRVDFLSFF